MSTSSTEQGAGSREHGAGSEKLVRLYSPLPAPGHHNTVGVLATSANSVPQTIQNNRAFANLVGIRVSGASQILGNQVYSNAVGISGHPSSGFFGLIANNVVYANANQGIFIERSFNAGGRIINNTVYQPVGEAIRLENVSQGMTLRNNILWVDSGYAIYVAANSQSNISSNYNLIHRSTDPNAHAGFWGGAPRQSLADWQAASGQDAASVAADPLLVDRDGSDNVLGYRASDGYDGGGDDNVLLRAGSHPRFARPFSSTPHASSGTLSPVTTAPRAATSGPIETTPPRERPTGASPCR